MLLAGVAWLVESYDVGVIGSVLPSLQKEFQLGAFSVGLLAIASTLGIVIGVIPAGWMADTIGRKKILIIGTAWRGRTRKSGQDVQARRAVCGTGGRCEGLPWGFCCSDRHSTGL